MSLRFAVDCLDLLSILVNSVGYLHFTLSYDVVIWF